MCIRDRDGVILDLVGDQFDLSLKNDATVTIRNGATLLVGDDLKMTSSAANVFVSGNSTLEARKRVAHDAGTLSFNNSTFIAGQALGIGRDPADPYEKAIHVKNSAEIISVNSTLYIHNTLLMDGGTLDLDNSCAIFGVHWDNRNGTMNVDNSKICLLYTSPSPRDATLSRMPSSA